MSTKQQKRERAALRNLVEMLTYKRPHGSKSEAKFINRFIHSLPGSKTTDKYGNIWLRVGAAPHRVMFCAHTDTVHRTEGRQKVGEVETLVLGTSNGECLGADNGAGVWMLRELILANVPGLYVFFRNEEHGGQGSTHFVNNHADVLSGVEIAVAFDRRGQQSVITHQMMGRTASDKFADDLCAVIRLGHKPDDSGVFTDTAMLAEIVPECTNISVGFVNEHSHRETLDVAYLFDLRDAMIAVDWACVSVNRDPHEVDDFYSSRSGGGRKWSSRYSAYYDAYKDIYDDYDDGQDWAPSSRSPTGTPSMSLVRIIQDHPNAVAEWLLEQGVDVDTFAQELDAMSGWTLGIASQPIKQVS